MEPSTGPSRPSALVPCNATLTSPTAAQSSAPDPQPHASATVWEKFFYFLMKAKLLGNDGRVIGAAADIRQLLELNEIEFERFVGLFHQPLILRTKCGRYYVEYKYGELILLIQEELKKNYPYLKIQKVLLTGSAVFKVLGWSYFLRLFKELKIDLYQSMPSGLIAALQEEFFKPLNDTDIRIIIPGISYAERFQLSRIVIKIFADRLKEKYNEEASETIIKDFGFSNICNVNIPQSNTRYLITGFGDRVQNESELLWIDILNRYHLSVNDALTIEAKVPILKDAKAGYFKICPESSYPYPLKVFFDKALLVKTYDDVEKVDKSGWGRHILDLVKGYVCSSEKDEPVLLRALLSAQVQEEADIMQLMINWQRGMLSHHGGKSASLRLLFILRALCSLLANDGINARVLDVERFRWEMLQGMPQDYRELIPILKPILLLLSNPKISARTACETIQSLFFLAYFLAPEGGYSWKIFHDPIRARRDLLVQFDCGNQKLWFNFPFECSKALESLSRLPGIEPFNIIEEFYYQLFHQSNGVMRPIDEIIPVTFVALSKAIVPLCWSQQSVFKAFGARIALLIRSKVVTYEYERAILSVFHHVINYEKSLKMETLCAQIKNAYWCLDWKLLETSDPSRWLKMLASTANPICQSAVWELLRNDPTQIENLEEACRYCMHVDFIFILRAWKRYSHLFSKDAFLHLFPLAMKAYRSSSEVQKQQADMGFLLKGCDKFLGDNPDNLTLDLPILYLLHENLRQMKIEGVFPVIQKLTTGAHFKANPKIVLKIWFELTSGHNLLLRAWAYTYSENRDIVGEVLIEGSKALKSCDDSNEREFAASCRQLIIGLIECVCSRTIDLEKHKERAQWIFGFFFDQADYKIELSTHHLRLLASGTRQIFASMGDAGKKLSIKTVANIESRLKSTMEILYKAGLYSDIIAISSQIFVLAPSLINHAGLWEYILKSCVKLGGMQKAADLYSDSLFKYLELAMGNSPLIEALVSETVIAALKDRIIHLLKSNDLPAANQWLKKLNQFPTRPEFSGHWLSVLHAYMEKKWWVEAAEVMLARKAEIKSTLNEGYNELLKILDVLIVKDSLQETTLVLRLLAVFKVQDEKKWDNVFRKIEMLDNKELHEQAWDIFWSITEPYICTDRTRTLRESCLLAVMQGVVKSNSSRVLKSMDLEEKIYGIVGRDPNNKYFRHVATLILKGTLSNLTEKESIIKYSAWLIKWRNALYQGEGNSNHRAINILLIKRFSFARARELINETVSIADDLIRSDVLDKHLEERCDALLDLSECMIANNATAQIASLKKYFKYIMDSRAFPAYIKRILMILAEINAPEMNDFILEIFLRTAVKSNMVFLEKDSTPFMQGIFKILKSMLKTYDATIIAVIDEFFLKPIVNKEYSKNWNGIFRRWLSLIITHASEKNEPEIIFQSCKLIFKHPIFLARLDDPQMMASIVKLILTLRGKRVDDAIDIAVKSIFVNGDISQANVKAFQNHPWQPLRQMFMRALLRTVLEVKNVDAHIKTIDFTAAYLETIIHKPEESECINHAFVLLVNFISRFCNTSIFEVKYMAFMSTLVNLQCEGRRPQEKNPVVEFHIGPLEEKSYVHNTAGYKPGQMAKKRGPQVIPEVKNVEDFITPTSVIAIKPSVAKPTQSVLANFVKSMSLFLYNLVNIEPRSPLNKAYAMDTVYINLIELFSLMGQCNFKESFEIVPTLRKFIEYCPETTRGFDLHMIKCVGLLKYFAENRLNYRDEEEFIHTSLYVTSLARNNIPLKPEKLRAIIFKICREFCKAAPLEIMGCRIAKAIALLSKYHQDFANQNDEFLEIQMLLINTLKEFLPAALEAGVFQLDGLTPLILCSIDHMLKDRFLFCFDQFLVIMNGMVAQKKKGSEHLLNYLSHLLAKEKKMVFEGAWGRYFLLLEKLVEPCIALSSDINVFATLFDLRELSTSVFAHNDGKKCCAVFYKYLEGLVAANKKGLAIKAYNTVNATCPFLTRSTSFQESVKALLGLPTG